MIKTVLTKLIVSSNCHFSANMSKNDLPLLPSAEQFFHHQNKLLSLEREEETGRNRELITNHGDIKQLERQGIALRKTTILERRTGLYGKSILVFGKPGGGKDQNGELPANTLSNGKCILDLLFCKWIHDFIKNLFEMHVI